MKTSKRKLNLKVITSVRRILIICLFGVLIGIVYGRTILPIFFAFPLYQDIAQDYLGARALINHNEELYPLLSSAFERLGLEWPAYHHSTHPPTAFLFMLPLSLFSYPVALVFWIIAMFVCLLLTARALNLPWKVSLLASFLSLAWPGTIWSLGQLTPIWLLFSVLAYSYRHRPFFSGLHAAIASLPKFMAAPILIYHIKKRDWKAFIGFGSIWLTAVITILLLRSDSFTTYIITNQTNSLEQILRPDNGALLILAWRFGGWLGVGIISLLILLVLWRGYKYDNSSGWACLVWSGIALLPVAWVYSVLPLLPWLIMSFFSKNKVSSFFAGVAILLPYLAPVPTSKPVFIGLTILTAGIAFVAGTSEIYLPSFFHRLISRPT